jgi:EAL domain-containing protein (putative c-di-GMP-specific phosphodiesterase class I)
MGDDFRLDMGEPLQKPVRPVELRQMLAGVQSMSFEPDASALLTETAAMGNPTLMLEVLTRLRLKGFKLAIDDFGTGYSSMLQLHRLPFSELKIDQSFVAEMEHSEARIIVGAIAGLGKNLGLELVAEGVENQALLKHLVGFGCEIGQGYHFSRPMQAVQVLDWLANNGATPTFSGAAAA